MTRFGKSSPEVFYTRINRSPIVSKNKWYGIKKRILPIYYWAFSYCRHTPGLFFHRYIVQLALRLRLKGRLNSDIYSQIMTLPMDSVRYFEFDFMWRSITRTKLSGRYLDISSPRMFPLIVVEKNPELHAAIVNPDVNDLEATRHLFDSCGVAYRCTFDAHLIDDLELMPESFDLITSISVIEHIPGSGDQRAIEKMWELLKPGGKLLLSVPCAKKACEEYIDFDEYHLLEPDENNFVFGQRFYDDNLLRERVFSITGLPSCKSVYGEKQSGFFLHNREEKINNPNYPYWREPYMMGEKFAFYGSIIELPGWGVIAMEFCKNG